MHVYLSLANKARLLNLGLLLGLAKRDPPQAMIADKASFDCFPSSLHHPPLTCRTTSAIVPTTRSLACRHTASCHDTHSIGKPAVFKRRILAFDLILELVPTAKNYISSDGFTCVIASYEINLGTHHKLCSFRIIKAVHHAP